MWGETTEEPNVYTVIECHHLQAPLDFLVSRPRLSEDREQGGYGLLLP